MLSLAQSRMSRRRGSSVFVLLLFVATADLLASDSRATTPSSTRPNIVIVMADDLGFSDIGCYGGEIETPNLDQLAAHGLRFNQFYNCGRCCPTRAALLTGLHQHLSGVGHMTGNSQRPAYQGFLNRNCATIAELLRSAGYRTMMAGKWHVGSAPGQWPLDRGFDRYFGCPTGGGFYFPETSLRKRRSLVLDNDEIEFPSDGYVTDLFSDQALTFIDEAVESSDPFFLYLAHIAPHWPLQAKPEDIEKYKGRYSAGWQTIREARFAKQCQLKILPEQTQLSPPHEQVGSWDALSEERRSDLAHRMAVYAAQVDCIDQHIGKLITKLKQHGRYENTLILFLSDNGCSAEGGPGGFRRGDPTSAIGTDASYASAGLEWANVSDTPFRRFKRFTYEGGIASPLIVHWPAAIEPKGEVRTDVGHVTDILPTCLDVAGVDYPSEFNGHRLLPLAGRSLKPTFKGDRLKDRDLFWSHEGNRAVRRGKWKLVADNHQKWELYDLGNDRTETQDLAEKHSDVRMQLARAYREWADRVGVEPWPLEKRPAAARERPNVILVMADDVGVEAFGCYGSQQYRTPRLDQLAREGMRFTACHSQPLCTPSRVKLMTGRSNIFNYAAFSILPKAAVGPTRPTLSQRFRGLGYRTLVAGKWQLLGAEHYSPRFRRRGSWPLDVGFDHCCLWQVDQLGSRYWGPLLNVDGVNQSFPESVYGPDVCTDRVLEMIKASEDQPFFIYYPMILVHSPFEPTPSTTRNPDERTRQSNFEEMVQYMDHLIGRIVDQLETSGKARETLLIFTSDNGTHKSIQSQWQGRTVRGGKGKTSRAGTHVPLIVRWPGVVPAGATCEDLIDFVDFYPTLMEVVASTSPHPVGSSVDGQPEGVSFWPQLHGAAGRPREWSFGYYNPRPESTAPIRFVRSPHYKLYDDGRFYDLRSDPDERQPLAVETLPIEAAEVHGMLGRALAKYPQQGLRLLNMESEF